MTCLCHQAWRLSGDPLYLERHAMECIAAPVRWRYAYWWRQLGRKLYLYIAAGQRTCAVRAWADGEALAGQRPRW